MKFSKIYKMYMEDLTNKDDIDPIVGYFISDEKYANDYQKLQDKLNEELNTLKKADIRLNDLYLEFETSITSTDEGIVMAFYNPKFENEIAINIAPFAKRIIDGENFDDVIVDYIYTYDGEHILQHECAHYLDYLENGDRGLQNSHDKIFKQYEDELDLKTKLNQY